MSWTRIDHRRVPEGVPWVTMGIARTKRGGTGRPQVTLKFSSSLAKHIYMHSYKVSVELGTGDHEGWIRLRPCSENSGGLTPQYRDKSPTIRFSSGHLGLTESHKTEKLPTFSVLAGRDEIGPHIDLELPPWGGGLTEEERDERERQRVRDEFGGVLQGGPVTTYQG